MKILVHKKFVKDYNKLTKAQRAKFKERRNLFLEDEFSPILNNHALIGEYKGYRSINVTGDLRAIFRRGKESVLFVALDKHSNLYG